MKGKMIAGSLAGVTALGAVIGAGIYASGGVEAETSSVPSSEETAAGSKESNSAGNDKERITADEAVMIAEKETNGKAVELQLDMEDQKYDIEVEGEQEYDVEVAAFSGDVIQKENEGDKENEEPLVQDGDSVSLEDIVASGMGEVSGELNEWELDREKSGYELSIETNEQEGDFFINDADGTIASKDIEDEHDDNDDDRDDNDDD
ncbi:PepSY domain-containing protein [Marinococcus sp. PL1-022]|uniref:PepSY domain-containing protein n=1 Tax=Marinococcus sp. PL1-022 TaxID=3095363 RepID=UPI0029C2AB1D|nr:PepSY domain-containing protein [Marinococcus sp. PL1-022]MDX6151790.1 PepSY domain-containing protein [Marinococcus sp. PL1-022]